MRLVPLIILVATFGLSACVLDRGIDPSELVAQELDGASSDEIEDGDGVISADGGITPQGDGVITGDDTVGPTEAPPVPLRQGAWPATFTTTLQGGGWTLQPLGAQRGFMGTVSAPDGSLHLEALP
ncbi:MAG: hypothetical protein ACPGU1_12505 [Myxococcota bacterium]